MISKQELDARLAAGTKKRQELYDAEVARQEAAVDKVINEVIDRYTTNMTYQTTREILICRWVFNGKPLPEVVKKVEELGLTLHDNFGVDLVGKLYF